jgi:hypothetical protein
VLVFVDDLRAASGAWAETKDLIQHWDPADSEDNA